MIKEKAYAKINLALEVMDVIDGYHMVNNIMIPISIYDEIEAEISDSIIIDDDPFPGENIMEKSAKAFFNYTKINGGVHLKIKKNIPSAAGLAGGSTDAACVIRILNSLYNANLSNDEMREISETLGSDVSFFIEGKLAICKGRGEKVYPYNINYNSFRLLLVKPEKGNSTKEIYKNYKYVPNKKRIDNVNNIIEGLKNNDLNLLMDNIFNDLGDVALRLNDEMSNIYNELSNKGLRVFVSGSGPTMYIINPSDEDVKMVKELYNNTTTFVEECFVK